MTESSDPTITSISPSSAVAGTSITISGQNFNDVTKIVFGKTTLDVSVSNNSCTVTAPAAVSPGVVNVIAETSKGTPSTSVQFTYLVSPLLIRNNLQETTGHAGNICTSPDVICTGSGSLTYQQASADYGDYLNQSYASVGLNNFYVRAKNIGADPVKASAQMYSAPMSLLLTPQSWTPAMAPIPCNELLGSNQAKTLNSGDLGFTIVPFQPIPTTTGAQPSVMAIASLGDTVFPIPKSFENNGALALWTQSNPNVGQQNIALLGAGQSSFSVNLPIGNLNDQESEFMVTVTPNGSIPDYPVGAMVSAYISDTRAPISSDQPWSNHHGVTFEPIKVPANVNGEAGNELINLQIGMSSASSGFGKQSILISYYQKPSSVGAYEEELPVIKSYDIPHPKDATQTTSENLILIGSYELSFI